MTRRTAGVVLAAIIAVSCAAPVPPSHTPPGGSSSPATTSLPASSATPVQSVTPTVSLTTEELEIGWSADDPTGVGVASEIVDVVRSADWYVLLTHVRPTTGRRHDYVSWRSRDGRSWELGHRWTAEVPIGDEIHVVTAGGRGFVAGGWHDDNAALWSSADGRVWQQVTAIPSLPGAQIEWIGQTASRLVAFGHDYVRGGGFILTSTDGLEWAMSRNDTALAVSRGFHAVGAYDGRAVAVGFAERSEDPLATWDTTDGLAWTRNGPLDAGAVVLSFAGGPRGWVALGGTAEDGAVTAYNVAWFSSNGRSWARAASGPDVGDDLVAADAGFIAVGYVGTLPGVDCRDKRPFAGHTWTSSDGRTWNVMPVTDEFSSATVTNTLVVGRTLLGYGLRIPDAGTEMAVGRWTATLPETSLPAATSDTPSEPIPCGPPA